MRIRFHLRSPFLSRLKPVCWLPEFRIAGLWRLGVTWREL